MEKSVYDELLPVVQQAARSAAARWPGLEVDELENEAWQVALECLPNYRPSEGSLVGYVSRTLKVALRNACFRMTLPVHYPRNREWMATVVWKAGGESADEAVAVGAPRGAVTAPELESGLDMARARRRVREVVVDATASQPAVRAVMLSGGDVGPRHIADALGGTPEEYQRATRKVYARLRDEVRVPRSVVKERS